MKRFLAQLILLADAERVPILSADWFRYYLSWLIVISPISAIGDFLISWFENNIIFWFMFFAMCSLNALVGTYYHFKNGSFDGWILFRKNVELAGACIVVYIGLETIRLTAGDNLAGEFFGKLIQISCLLYPISGILKNVYILSEGKHPPAFIMKRLYNFEKKGDIEKLFKTSETDEELGELPAELEERIKSKKSYLK